MHTQVPKIKIQKRLWWLLCITLEECIRNENEISRNYSQKQHVKWCELMSVFFDTSVEHWWNHRVHFPHPIQFTFDHLDIDRCILVEGCLWSHISHTTSELSPLESSVLDEELDGELMDNWARSSFRRFTPLPLAVVILVVDLVVIRLVRGFLVLLGPFIIGSGNVPSQKNWTYSCIHPLALEVLSLCVPCPIYVFAFVDPN